jgi:hypothetical protein
LAKGPKPDENKVDTVVRQHLLHETIHRWEAMRIQEEDIVIREEATVLLCLHQDKQCRNARLLDECRHHHLQLGECS